MNLLDNAVQVRAHFDVNRDVVGSGLDKRLDMFFRLHDHQVHIKGQPGHAARRLDDERPHRDGRHKTPIHDINVNLVSAACLGFGDLLAQPGKIGSQDRWRDANWSQDPPLC